ncbi:hypothetical protein Angca_002475, partial [Angiostrongylus cantonensis]
LIAIFASCTWIGTNSVWMQLPLFTSVLPEGWNLPAYLAVVVQCGCIAPLIYTIVYKRCKSVEISKTRLIFSFLIVACLCQLGLVFLWKETILIGDKHYSVALYTLLFGLAVVDSVSSVLFMPFMSRFSPPYLNAYFVGMGFSSLIPSILALIQGDFTKVVFLRLVFLWKETILIGDKHYSVALYTLLFGLAVVDSVSSVLFMPFMSRFSPPYLNAYFVGMGFSSLIPSILALIQARELSGPSHIFILFTVSVINAQMNGIIPSISSFAALPYSQATYHYSIALSNLMMPLASFLSFFVIIRNLKILGLLSAMSTCATAFLVYLAALSPSRIFSSQSLGSVLSISASLVASGLHSFLRIAFASRLRECDDNESRLFWCGVFTQVYSY